MRLSISQKDTHEPQTHSRYSPIAELRRYKLQRARREKLIALFDRHFLESQEACRMKIIGQFRDLDDPDAFVWLRGFPDMQTRHRALAAFYDGPVWGEYSNSANATMIDSDDVLLLHPASNTDGFALPAERPGHRTEVHSPTVIQAVTYRLKLPAESGFLEVYEQSLSPLLRAAGDESIALFASDRSENTFSRLPIRVGENVLVAFSRFESAADLASYTKALIVNPAWLQAQVQASTYFIAPPVVARLAPTARSLLR